MEAPSSEDCGNGLSQASLRLSSKFAIAISFFIMKIGIMLLMMGAMGGFETKPEAIPIHTEVVWEIVKVRCKYCNTLNFETSQKCSSCGAHL